MCTVRAYICTYVQYNGTYAISMIAKKQYFLPMVTECTTSSASLATNLDLNLNNAIVLSELWWIHRKGNGNK